MTSSPQQWLADYQREGCLVVPDCLDASTLARLRDATAAITDDPDSVPPPLQHHIEFERDYLLRSPRHNDKTREQVGNAIRNIMELPLFNSLFAELILYPPLLDVLEVLFGTSEFAFHNYKCIIKAPRVSSRFRWHRDLPYLAHSTPNLITAMLCLDDMTEANGATIVLHGTHRIPHESVGEADMDIPEENLPREARRITLACPAGSAVLFHVNIIHGGGANRSDVPRRNIISIWSGPETYPTSPYRYAFQGLMPRSHNPARQRQVALALPGHNPR